LEGFKKKKMMMMWFSAFFIRKLRIALHHPSQVNNSDFLIYCLKLQQKKPFWKFPLRNNISDRISKSSIIFCITGGQ
jgi:hypothetical protein